MLVKRTSLAQFVRGQKFLQPVNEYRPCEAPQCSHFFQKGDKAIVVRVHPNEEEKSVVGSKPESFFFCSDDCKADFEAELTKE